MLGPFALLLLPLALPPQDPGGDPDERFAALEDQYSDARSAWLKKIRAADGGDLPVSPAKDFYPRFLGLARGGHAPSAVWCLENAAYSSAAPAEQAAHKLALYEGLVANHVDAPAMYDVIQVLGGDVERDGPAVGTDKALGLLERIRTSTSDEGIRAFALYSGGFALAKGNDDARDKRAVGLLRKFVEAFPDHLLTGEAEGLIFREEKLRIGMTAPDFESKDVDGRPVRLSDSRGKVTVVEFWGFW